MEGLSNRVTYCSQHKITKMKIENYTNTNTDTKYQPGNYKSTFIRKYYDKPRNKTRLVYGVGKNDADFRTQYWEDGKRVRYEGYRAWVGMIQRCYDPSFHNHRPTYQDCAVCEEWLSFSKFDEWFKNNYVEGFALDKDFLCPGNKEYGPGVCVFVPRWLNSLLNDSAATRGPHSQGVTYDKANKRYRASCSVFGKMKNLGRFKTETEAEITYLKFKSNYIHECTSRPDVPAKLVNSLLNQATQLNIKAMLLEASFNNHS